MAILPYYVANLNIEASYAAITGDYVEFPNLCFVDTLDNTDALSTHVGQHYGDLIGGMSVENVERIKRQNERRISVIIGNPPYNANQQNENDNNKNREYSEIDKRIRATYIKQSTAQKTKLYDMYVRFFRWASDRIKENGIVAFVSNSSFLHKHSFDGFRAVAEGEFNELWVLDLKGDARSSGENRRREGGNIFGNQIKVGIAIYCFVKKQNAHGFRIFYEAVGDFAKADEKIEFLHVPFRDRKMALLRPDAKHNWLNVTANDFEEFLPVAARATKVAKRPGSERAIFKAYSLGISTNWDEWLYDRDRKNLQSKVQHLIEAYDRVPADTTEFPDTLKWSRNLKRRLKGGEREAYLEQKIVLASYRPYSRRWLYQSALFTDELGLANELFPAGEPNQAICFSSVGSRSGYCVLAINGLADLHFGAAVDGYQQVTRYRYVDGQRLDNVTDWALAQFHGHYGQKANVSKDAIFAYVYAVLHDPEYRSAYAINLRRAFPHAPFYLNFNRWRDWGYTLLDLHINYEKVEPLPLVRTDVPDKKERMSGQDPVVILKADRQNGIIILNSETQLAGIPDKAWKYQLGHLTALDWVLEQHKERRPKDPVIRAAFNSYRFSHHKERVIDLLARVAAVSVRTVEIVEAMAKAARA